MEFWYTLTAAIVLITAFPYIRCFFKRMNCKKKINAFCRKKGYALYPTHLLWFLGNKNAKNCDLYIETADEVFAIKLFGMPRRRTVLVFKENGTYFIRSFIPLSGYGATIPRQPINGKPRRIPHYDFLYHEHERWTHKTIRYTLLIHPVSMDIRYQPEYGSEVSIGAGNVVNGMEIASLPRLLAALENSL